MPGESYRRRLRSLLLYLCYVFRALINSLVCWSFISGIYLISLIYILLSFFFFITKLCQVDKRCMCTFPHGYVHVGESIAIWFTVDEQWTVKQPFAGSHHPMKLTDLPPSFRFALDGLPNGQVALVSNSLNSNTCPVATVQVYLDTSRAVVAEMTNVNGERATVRSSAVVSSMMMMMMMMMIMMMTLE